MGGAMAVVLSAKLPLPEEHPNTVNALRNKRSEVVGDIAMHAREIEKLRAQLIHLDATLRLFDPNTDPEMIEGRPRSPRRSEYFEKGELVHRVYVGLRESDATISAEELTKVALADKGIPLTDRVTHRLFMCKFTPALADLRRRGIIEKIGHGRGVRWKLVPEERELI
jgi:hypothetical protein